MSGHVGQTTRPFLRWAGSKRALLPRLASYWGPQYGRYVEPFAGSASLFFALRPDRALLSDINGDLIDTFIAVRDNPREVYDEVTRIPRGKRSYLRVRALGPETLCRSKRAARFIFLNRHCFNGLYRTNSAGHFNVPFGTEGSMPPWDVFARCSSALSVAELRCTDFEDVLRSARKDDFFYIDPPYATKGRRLFREYSPLAFGVEDLERLNMGLEMIRARGAQFVVSYAYCPEAIALFRGWHVTKIRVQRNIAGFAKHRRRAYELFISSLAAPLDPGERGRGRSGQCRGMEA